MTCAFRSAPAQKRRPAPVTTATLDEEAYQLPHSKWHCVIVSAAKLRQGRRRTHHSRGSPSNQFRTRQRSFSIVGVIALRACGRLSVSKSTCSAGKPSVSSSDTGGGFNKEDIRGVNVFRVWEDRLHDYPDANVMVIWTLRTQQNRDSAHRTDVVARTTGAGRQFSRIRKVQRKNWQDTCTRSQC
jgi:hypothetical protein